MPILGNFNNDSGDAYDAANLFFEYSIPAGVTLNAYNNAFETFGHDVVVSAGLLNGGVGMNMAGGSNEFWNTTSGAVTGNDGVVAS
jgi:hypothetical protein